MLKQLARAATTVMALLCLAHPPQAYGQQSPSVTPGQLSGEWSGELPLDNGTMRLLLRFNVTDSTFEGKVFADADLFGTMEQGTLKGNVVHFKVDRYDFTGTVTGKRMAVDLIMWNGSTRKLSLIKTRDAELKSGESSSEARRQAPTPATREPADRTERTQRRGTSPRDRRLPFVRLRELAWASDS